MFCYPKFKNGKQELTRAYGKTAVSMMNITVYRLKAGEELEIAEPGMETAILILEGDVTMYCEDKEYGMKRKSVFTELPTCLHVSKDVAVIVKANAASEILVQSTENEKVFATRLFRPEDCVSFVSISRILLIPIWCSAKFTPDRAGGGAIFRTTIRNPKFITTNSNVPKVSAPAS